MKKVFVFAIAAVLVLTTSSATALTYTFDADAEGFQNVAWQANGTVKQTHTAGAWQMMMTKEFSWQAGGGAANQQLAMQAIANDPLAKIAFDVSVDGTSFPAGAGVWYSFNIVGNSDGAAGWTQIEHIVDGWQNPDQADLRTWHVERPLTALGWQPGDTWFQLWIGTNSDAAYPVNFFIDNVVVTPEPATLSMLGLGALAFLRKRK